MPYKNPNAPTSFPVPASGLHHSRGVYPNGFHKDNGVHPDHLAEHLKYNVTWRPGRALFVDGKCVNFGGVGEERCREIEIALSEQPVVMDRCNVPYH